jgi:hypothetical protein
VNTMSRKLIIGCLFLGIGTAVYCCWRWFGFDNRALADTNQSQAVAYKLLRDDNGDVIGIGVPADVTESQLRATLVRAANEHQDDPARDYMFPGLYLWIDAYLVKDDHQGTVTAGRLRRFVPPGNPAQRQQIRSDRTKYDEFEITLAKAQKMILGSPQTEQRASEYAILEDDWASFISIGVSPDVTEAELRALLVKAANEHVSDTRRTCGAALNLWIQGYLVKDGRRSKVMAGQLRRLTPPGKWTPSNEATFDWTKFDTVQITLEEARKALQ